MLHFQTCLIFFHITIFITQLDKKREWEMMCRVKPDVVKDKETERNLQRIATRWDCFCPLKNRYTKALIVIHFWLDLILKLCLLRAKWFISKPAYLILNSTRDFTGLMRQEFNIISVYLVWTCCRSYCFCSHENSVIRRAFFLQWLSEFIAISDYFCYLTLYLGHNQLCITVALCCPFTLHFFFFYHWHQAFIWRPLERTFELLLQESSSSA